MPEELRIADAEDALAVLFPEGWTEEEKAQFMEMPPEMAKRRELDDEEYWALREAREFEERMESVSSMFED